MASPLRDVSNTRSRLSMGGNNDENAATPNMKAAKAPMKLKVAAAVSADVSSSLTFTNAIFSHSPTGRALQSWCHVVLKAHFLLSTRVSTIVNPKILIP